MAATAALAALAGVQIWALRGLWRPGLPLGWDTLGHFAKVDFLLRELLPRGQVDGWFPYWHGGFQLFLFYPPGFYWLTAALAFVLGAPLAFKSVLLASLVAVPPGLYRLSREAGSGRAGALAAALFGVFAGTTYGGGIVGTFAVGLVPNAFGLALLLFVLAASLRALRSGSRAALAGASLLLGFLLASHTFSAYQAVLSLGLLGALAALAQRAWAPLARRALVVLAGALSVSCFWWLPALLKWNLRGPIGVWQQPDRGALLLAHWRGELVADPLVTWLGWCGLAVALVWGRGPRRWLGLLTLVTLGLALNLFNRWLPFAGAVASSQFMRFHGPLALLWALQAGSCVGDLWRALRCGWPARAAWLLPVAVLAAALHWSWPRYQAQERDYLLVESDRPGLEQVRDVAAWLERHVAPDERILTEFDWGRGGLFGTPHVLNQYAALHAHRMDLNGSFAEGAASTRTTLVLGQELRAPEASFEDRLQPFAVRYAVTYTDEGAQALSARPAWERIHVAGPLAVFRRSGAAPFARGPDGEEAGRLVPAVGGWAGRVHVDRMGWLHVAVNASPNWRAEVDGSPVEVATGPQGLLAVPLPAAGPHQVRLSFRWLWSERLARAFSLAALLALVVGLLRRPPPPA